MDIASERPCRSYRARLAEMTRRSGRRRRRRFWFLSPVAPVVIVVVVVSLAVSNLVVHQGAALRGLHVALMGGTGVGVALLGGHFATSWHSDNSSAIASNSSSGHLLEENEKNSNNNNEDDEDKSPPTSPVASMLSNFPNRAVEREVRRHDRYVVDSLAFLNKLDRERVEQYASEAAVADSGATTDRNKPFTIIVLTVNRSVPYITVPISMLLRGHEPNDFRDFMNVHVVNIERRPGKESYYLFDEMETKLSSLMTFHRWTEPYPNHQHILDQKLLLFADKKMDYIRSLELCQTSGSKWCIVLEDDALPVDNLVGNLLKYVDRLTFFVKERRHNDDKAKASQEEESGEEITAQQVGMIKLYSPYNCGHLDNDQNLLRDEYAEIQYNADVASGAEDGSGYGHRFSQIFHNSVALAFPLSTLSKLISYLRRQPSDGAISVDEQIHNFWVRDKSDLEVLEVSPSLVNHIGFYSEHRRAGDISQIVCTDVRFRLAGEIEQRGNKTFPSTDMLGNFAHNNEAVQREVEKHDRYLLDSIAHLNRIDAFQAEKYIQNDGVGRGRFTFVVLTINRSLPYLAVFLSTLIRGHSAKDFSQLDVHVANIERRQGKEDYQLFDELKRKIPFVTFHDWTAPYQQYENITDPKVSFFANQRVDYIRALRLCQGKGTEYCLVFEDDALPCVGFLKKFIQYVDTEKYRTFGSRPNFIDPDKLRPGQNLFKVVANPKPVDQKDEDAEIVRRETVGVMKLFYHWNDGHTKLGLSKKYSANEYPRDKVLDIYEAKAEGKEAEEIKHRIFFSRAGYGAVADAFHSTVVPKLIDFLETHDTSGTYPVDAQVNHKFIAAFNFERLVVSPSIVNHIGYMSEHANDVKLNTRRISTDVRFQLDDRSYWKLDEEKGPTSTNVNASITSSITVHIGKENGRNVQRGKIGGHLIKGKAK